MKKIMISSILALTACFTMVSQASAAPHVAKHPVTQVKHKKASVKFDNKHQYVKKKVVVSKHQSKKAATHLKVKSNYQAKHTQHRNKKTLRQSPF